MRFIKMFILIALALGAIVGIWRWKDWRRERAFEESMQPPRDQTSGKAANHSPNNRLEAEIKAIRDEITHHDQTTWANEVLAQSYEQTIIHLWDESRAATDKLDAIKHYPFESILVPSPSRAQPRSHEVREIPSSPDTRAMTRAEFLEFIDLWKAAGFELVQSEWYHEAFDPPGDGPAKSVFAFEFHVLNKAKQQRLRLEGDLGIEWSASKDANNLFQPVKLTVQRLNMTERIGPPAFEAWGGEAGLPMVFGGGPLLCRDLDGDGLSEIALPADNIVYRNEGDGVFRPGPLCAHPVTDPRVQEQRIRAAIMADFNGDGRTDLIVAGGPVGVVMFLGDEKGAFSSQPVTILKPSAALISPQAITAGDINGDGLPDLWIAQFKASAELGSMPTPFWDANDGFRSFLLLNQGDGKFVDGIVGSGLEDKRYRRTYACSFVDLDGDGDLDLLLSNDYCGEDIHLNDGKGHFTEATAKLLDERHMFGMGHTFADFDRDGRLDFYVTGMDLATVRRLDYMRLGREDFPDHTRMRGVMAYGSRMFLAQDEGGYKQAGFNDLVARPRWAWGCAALDFANDGLIDLCVVNGQISRTTAKTYTPRAWTQEIYLGKSSPNLALQRVLNDEDLFPGNKLSFEGFQHNALYINEAGKLFRNDGFLMDVAGEYDSRSLVADDLDGDGRVDLIVSSIDFTRPGKIYHGALHVLHNVWQEKNNWTGVRVPDAPGNSALGAKIQVVAGGHTNLAQLVTGDSYGSQHPSQKHFGLGKFSRIDRIEVRWQNGRTKTITNPDVNQYHTVHSDNAQ